MEINEFFIEKLFFSCTIYILDSVLVQRSQHERILKFYKLLQIKHVPKRKRKYWLFLLTNELLIGSHELQVA